MGTNVQPVEVRDSGRASFGLFEADFRSGELRRGGARVRLQAQPFRVLTLLLERAGQVVSREELQEYLWGKGTVVDFEHSLGTAINKIRDALGDSAENPRFIETLARRGYRFIAPVSFLPGAAEEKPPSSLLAPTSPDIPEISGNPGGPVAILPPLPDVPAAASDRNRLLRWWIGASAVIALTAMAALGYWLGRVAQPSPTTPLQITHLTTSGRVSPGDTFLETFPATASDGARIFFPELESGRIRLAQALIADGDARELVLPGDIVAPLLGDISPDGSKLLVRNHIAAETEQTLWIVPTLGGEARQVPDIQAHDATWMPDGQSILFANGDSLWIAGEDGSRRRLFAQLPGRAFWMRWSPAHDALRFTLLDPENHTTALWEVDQSGKRMHPLLPQWSQPASECCGSWTPDGRSFVFASHHSGDNIWMLGQRGAPVQLTNGPLNYSAPIVSRNGRDVFFVGADTRAELLEFHPASRQFLPFGDRLPAASRVAFSRDGKWMAWVNRSTLWRSRSDGTERVQLTAAPAEVFMMSWSPNSRQIAFMARGPGKRWQILSIDADGSNLHPLYPEDRNQADPDWSPDGKEIVFGRVPGLMGEVIASKAIYILHLATGKVETIPGSAGLFSPRWSPDGRFIAALSLDMNRIMLYDTATKQWSALAHHSAADPVWTHDSRALYFHDYLQKNQQVYRVRVPDGAVEPVADLEDLRFADAVDYQFAGLSSDDVPLVSARMSTANLYTVRLPGQKDAP